MSYEYICLDNQMVDQIFAVYNKRVKFENPELPESINLSYAVQDSVTKVLLTKLDELLVPGDASIREERYIVLSYKGNFELSVIKDTSEGLSCRVENAEENHIIPEEIADVACKLCAYYNDDFHRSEYERKIVSENAAKSLEDSLKKARFARTEERKRTLEFFRALESQNAPDRIKDYAEYLCGKDRNDLSELVKNTRINAIPVISEEVPDDMIPVGSSKCGGYPDLPPEIQYPLMGRYTVYQRDSIENYEESSMQLAAQINLSECSPYDTEGLLPKHGMIYIFWSGDPYDIKEYSRVTKIKHMFYDRNNASFRVYYYDGDSAKLRRVKPEKPYCKKYFDAPLPSKKISFSYSCYEYDTDRYKKELGEFADKDYSFRVSGDKLLGYADKPDSLFEIPDNHINLFSLSCSGQNNKIFWHISRSDLLKKNFDKAGISNYIAR